MWQYEHTIETKAPVSAIWNLYQDVSTWTKWDEGIEHVELNGPFAVGTTGSLTPKGQTSLPFTIVEAQANKGFTDETEIPGAGVVVRFEHRLTTIENGLTRMTHRVTISGPSAEVLGSQIGPAITAGIPNTMKALADYALTHQ